MQIDANRFLNSFFEEVDEHLAHIETILLRLEQTPRDQELLHSLFRAVHSIKGTSGMLSFPELTHFAHVMENLLGQLRSGQLLLTQELVTLLLRAADTLQGLVKAAKQETGPSPVVHEVQAALEQVLVQQPPEPPLSGPPPSDSATSLASCQAQENDIYRVIFTPGRDIFRQGMEPALLLRDLASLGEVVERSLDFSHLPALPVLDPESCYLSWIVVLQTPKTQDEIQDEIQEIFAFVEESSTLIIEALTAPVDEAIQITQPASSATVSRPADVRDSTFAPTTGSTQRSHSSSPSSIRVPTDRVDTLINLIGETVITQSMISQAVNDFSADKLPQLQEVVLELERNIRELQERVMAVRMLPINSVFSRFPRTVRDLAASLHKEVVLQTLGEETELDKAMLEGIGDPLTHLVRNAIDHGIEPPAERIALGKPGQGTIRLHAFHQGGKVSIEVRDDGRGLDTERIRHKGITQGLIRAEDTLSEEQIHALIFAPGFSTNDIVTDVSGRGVGMDVVKQNIEALNGTVSVSSDSGEGVCFRLRLPLTLAILDGLSLCVGKEVYILPLVNIVESIRPHPGSVKQIFGQGEVILVRDLCLPLVRLHTLFGISAQASEPHHGLVIIIEQEGQQVAVFVDALLGQQQVVIKSLETNFRKTQGIAGATILGDGRVALILDVSELVTLARQEITQQKTIQQAAAQIVKLQGELSQPVV